MKKLIQSLIAVTMLAVASFASATDNPTVQVSNSDYSSIVLPFTSVAGGSTSNVIAGWSSATSYTNITTTWSSSAGAFINTTNVVSVTNTEYANVFALGKEKVPIQIETTNGTAANGNGTTITNFIVKFATSVTDGNFDTNHLQSFTNDSRAADTTVFTLDMTGLNYARVFSIQNLNSNTAHGLGITKFVQSNKKN